MEDYTLNKNLSEFEEYTILGKNLTTFITQVGFIENSVIFQKQFNNISDFYKKIFEKNKEYFIISWNGIPFRLSYNEDIPFVIYPLINILTELVTLKKNKFQSEFRSNTTQIQFNFLLKEDEILEINAKFLKISGDHTIVLNKLSKIIISKKLFLQEWKLLLEQLLTVLCKFNPIFINKESQKLKMTLQNLTKKIKNRPNRYQYNLK